MAPRSGAGSDGSAIVAKHERMTVAISLAENLHHSRQKVEGRPHEGLQAQKTARAAGARPGVLEEPEPQGGAVTDGYVAAPVPSLVTPVPHCCCLEARGRRSRTRRWRRLRRRRRRSDEMKSLFVVPRALQTLAQIRRFEELCAQTSASVASLPERRKRKEEGEEKDSKKLLSLAQLPHENLDTLLRALPFGPYETTTLAVS